MADRIETCAWISVARGCGFGALAIVTTMVGLSGYPAAALKFGGQSSLLMSFIMIVMAVRAPRKNYKRTEVWLLLDEASRPPPSIAQRVIASARRDVLIWFARLHAGVALALYSLLLLVVAARG